VQHAVDARRFDVVVIVDAHHPRASRFMDSGELVEALPNSSEVRNEFQIEMDQTARNL
jgi:hypothetical protein